MLQVLTIEIGFRFSYFGEESSGWVLVYKQEGQIGRNDRKGIGIGYLRNRYIIEHASSKCSQVL